jgi:hypothetical protein
MLGRVIEIVTGKTYNQALSEFITGFGVKGMAHSHILNAAPDANEAEALKITATGVSKVGRAQLHPLISHPSHGIKASTATMATVISRATGGNFLSPAIKAQFNTVDPIRSNQNMIGWYYLPMCDSALQKCKEIRTHTGSGNFGDAPATVAWSFWDPSSGKVMTAMINSAPTTPGETNPQGALQKDLLEIATRFFFAK